MTRWTMREEGDMVEHEGEVREEGDLVDHEGGVRREEGDMVDHEGGVREEGDMVDHEGVLVNLCTLLCNLCGSHYCGNFYHYSCTVL